MPPLKTLYTLLPFLLVFPLLIAAQYERPPQGVILRSALSNLTLPILQNSRHPDILDATSVRFMLRPDRSVDADTVGVGYVDSKGYSRNSTCHFVGRVDEGHAEDVTFLFAHDDSFLHSCGLQYGVAVVCENETATCVDIGIRG